MSRYLVRVEILFDFSKQVLELQIFQFGVFERETEKWKNDGFAQNLKFWRQRKYDDDDDDVDDFDLIGNEYSCRYANDDSWVLDAGI